MSKFLEKLESTKNQFKITQTLFNECIKQFDVFNQIKLTPKFTKKKLDTKKHRLAESKKNYELSHLMLDDVKNEILCLVYDLQSLDIEYRCAEPLQYAMKEIAFIASQDRRLFYNFEKTQWSQDSNEKLEHIIKEHTKSHYERIEIVIDITQAAIESLIDGGHNA